MSKTLPDIGFVPLVEGANFLVATRDTGYRNLSAAISELVDNALEADAQEIRIGVSRSETNGDVEITVIDDGHGIAPDALASALQFGGTNRFDSRVGLGRFGMGLPNSSVSQARRVELFSWQQSGGVWHSFLDVDEMRNGTSKGIPSAGLRSLPDSLQSVSDHGTAVIWRRCDRLHGRRLETLVSAIHGSLGRVFRYFLWDGVKVSVNDIPVDPIDPLFCKTSPFASRADAYGDVLSYEMRTADGLATVQVRFSELPLHEWHDVPNAEKRRLGIAKGAGVSIVRAKREIAYGWHLLGGKRKENYDDWWRCELSFEPQLDEQFGVTHSKQGIRPTPELDSVLGRDLERIAHDLNRRVRHRYALVRSRVENHAARLAGRKEVLLPAVNEKTSAPGQRSKRPNSRPTLTRPGYLVVFESLANGDFYSARRRSKNIELVINPEHAFYRKVYAPLLTNRAEQAQRFGIECLLLALARVEVKGMRAVEKVIASRRRNEWSDVLAAFLQRS